MKVESRICNTTSSLDRVSFHTNTVVKYHLKEYFLEEGADEGKSAQDPQSHKKALKGGHTVCREGQLHWGICGGKVLSCLYGGPYPRALHCPEGPLGSTP